MIIIAGLAAIIFGYYDILLLRINENGTLDQAFGNNGFTVTSFSGQNDFAYAMTVQNDAFILRYNNGGVTSLSELSAPNEFAVYPDPVSVGEQITIYVQQGFATDLQIQIADVTGSIQFNKQLVRSDKAKFQLQVPPGLSSGLYFITLTDSKFRQVKKLLVN